MIKRRILVIDDNKDIHSDIRKVFTKLGQHDQELTELEAALFGEATPNETMVKESFEMVIDSAYQGEEGVRMAVEAAEQGDPYYMAFVDVRMPPGIDGIQTIKKLWTEVPELQCVICTAYSDYDWEDIVRQLRHSSKFLILKKPFDAVEVLQLAQSLGEKVDLASTAKNYHERLERKILELTSVEAELRTYNAELEIARAEAEGANRAKSQFLANVTHELRTPLNAVIGMTELLLDGTLNTSQRKYVRTVKSSANTLLELINEILDVSKIEAGKMELECIDFNLRDVIEPVVQVVAYRCQAKGLELGCYIDPQIASQLRGDPSRLRQVLTNLANNAAKFTETGGVEIDVSLAEDLENVVTVKFEVRDTGIGIAEDRLEVIFQSFSQADVSTTRKYGGTGLGLTIAKQLSEMMGGQIGVQSEPGKGSRFWFTVPLEKALPSEQDRWLLPAKLANLRILIVDDDPISQNILCKQLAAWGYAADTVSESEAALDKLRTAAVQAKPFTAVLLDLGMPERTSNRLSTRIRATSELANVLLIAMIPISAPCDVSDLRASGFNDYVSKPIVPSELYNSLLKTIPQEKGLATSDMPDTPIPASGSLPKAKRKGARILLAEDNSINQDVAVEILTKSGYECRVVVNGKEAVKAVQEEEHDLVLMDCQMPVMSGLEATQLIRRAEKDGTIVRAAPIPIIALTANAMKGDSERCLAAGMTEYLSKPLDPSVLVKRIESCLDAVEEHCQSLTETSRSGLPPDGSCSEIPPLPATAVVDLPSLLNRCMGNHDLAAKLVSRFQKQLVGSIDQMKAKLAEGNHNEVATLAHELKGSAANVSAERVRQLAKRLESSVREGDMKDAQSCLAQLHSEAQIFEQYSYSGQPATGAPTEDEEVCSA